jgi:hypothetical protein
MRRIFKGWAMMTEDNLLLEQQQSCATAETTMVPCPHVDLEKKATLLNLDDWQSLRWLNLREGKSARWISKQFGISRKTVLKYLKEPEAPRYRLSERRERPVTGPWRERVERIIEEDKCAPRKQRHTAKRIFERLRDEHG